MVLLHLLHLYRLFSLFPCIVPLIKVTLTIFCPHLGHLCITGTLMFNTSVCFWLLYHLFSRCQHLFMKSHIFCAVCWKIFSITVRAVIFDSFFDVFWDCQSVKKPLKSSVLCNMSYISRKALKSPVNVPTRCQSVSWYSVRDLHKIYNAPVTLCNAPIIVFMPYVILYTLEHKKPLETQNRASKRNLWKVIKKCWQVVFCVIEYRQAQEREQHRSSRASNPITWRTAEWQKQSES